MFVKIQEVFEIKARGYAIIVDDFESFIPKAGDKLGIHIITGVDRFRRCCFLCSCPDGKHIQRYGLLMKTSPIIGEELELKQE